MHIRCFTERLFSLREYSFKSQWNKAEYKDLLSGPWRMRLVCSTHNEDTLGPFRTDSVDVCCAAGDCQSPGIMRPRIRQQQTVGRLVLSEPGSYTNCTGWWLFHAREGWKEKRRRAFVQEMRKDKTPYENIQHENMLYFLMWPVATTETSSSIEGCQ